MTEMKHTSHTQQQNNIIGFLTFQRIQIKMEKLLLSVKKIESEVFDLFLIVLKPESVNNSSFN